MVVYPGQVVSGQADANGGAKTKVFPQTLVAIGGQVLSQYTWSRTTGSAFPLAGLSLDANGVVSGSGSSIQAGTYTLHVDVKDATSISRSGTVTLRIDSCNSAAGTTNPCMAVDVQSTGGFYLPAGKVGTEYAATIFAMGGTPPYRWAKVSGELPLGMSIDASGGVFKGKPTVAGTFNVSVQITDNQSKNTTASFTLVIAP
ncbi:MAG: Ig domain-containing protein [Gemmatimonadaceae bacterium]|nr:Ig domain-containing protein [Gemmatimonadaceae bacterium]